MSSFKHRRCHFCKTHHAAFKACDHYLKYIEMRRKAYLERLEADGKTA